MVSESGCGGAYGAHDPGANFGSEEFQDEYLTDIFEVLWANPHVSGFAIWQMNDNRTYSRTSVEQSGKLNMAHSIAGIFNLQRQPKMSAQTVRKYFGMK